MSRLKSLTCCCAHACTTAISEKSSCRRLCCRSRSTLTTVPRRMPSTMLSAEMATSAGFGRGLQLRAQSAGLRTRGTGLRAQDSELRTEG